MCSPVVVGAMALSGGLKAISQYQQGRQQASNLRYQANLLDTQKMLAQRTADQNTTFAQTQAYQESKSMTAKYAGLAGTQKAALAANGIGGGSVTAADIAGDTFDKKKMDELAIRYNADVKSWEYQENAKNQIWDLTNQQNQLRVAAKNAKIAGRNAAIGTLISTAASVARAGNQMGMWGKTSTTPKALSVTS